MRRILVVDDNPGDQELLIIAHERSGLAGEVLAWPSGCDPIAWTRERARPEDVVVVDLNMPRIHGTRIIGALSGAPGRPAIVALSGSGNPRDREAALTAGADLYLVKPDAFDAWLQVAAQVHAVARRAGEGSRSGSPQPNA
jgi:CheY-like chemotaxis protein